MGLGEARSGESGASSSSCRSVKLVEEAVGELLLLERSSSRPSPEPAQKRIGELAFYLYTRKWFKHLSIISGLRNLSFFVTTIYSPCPKGRFLEKNKPNKSEPYFS